MFDVSCARLRHESGHRRRLNIVSSCLEFLDGARSDLGMDAVDELLLQLWRQHQRADGPSGYLLINAFLGASSGDQSLNEVFRKNSEPVLDPIVSLE